MAHKEDRTSHNTALESLDWIADQFVSGKLKKWRWTAADEQKRQQLASLHGEWTELAKDGPPDMRAYKEFMLRFVPLYNAIWNRTKKGLCVECWTFFTWTSTKAGKFCNERCATRVKQRSKGDKFKQLIERMNTHRSGCLACKRNKSCAQLQTFASKMGRWMKETEKTEDDEMNLRDYAGHALEIAMEEQARAEVGGTVRKRR